MQLRTKPPPTIAGPGSTTTARTERTFAKRRVQLGEVVCWVEQSIILRKNLYYGHFHWFFSDLHYQNLEFVIPNLFEEQLSDT